MIIGQAEIKKMLSSVSEIWKKNHAYLSEIDSRFGDGDHGITINKIALLIDSELGTWTDASIGEFISSLGTKTMGVNGGSAGPLYGTMIGGLAKPLEDTKEIDGPLLKAMFWSSLEEMRDITKATIGDKTMMDALILAVEAADQATDDIEDILAKAKEAAVRGAKESEDYISKYGRARSYKEQTIGTPDAGAVSTSLFFVGLGEFNKNILL